MATFLADVLDFILSEQGCWSILILAIAAIIQAAVGFAAALFAMPLLMLVGNDLMSAQVLLFSAMFPQNCLGVWRLRENVKLSEVAKPAAIRLAAMPIGIVGLAYVLTWETARINQFVGILILCAVISQAFIGVEWKNATKWYWMLVTFGGSGILQGLSGMSGPPLVLWVHGQRYSADRARAFLFSIYVSNFAPQVLLLWWRFGAEVWLDVVVAFVALPAVLLGAMLGLRIGKWIGDRWLRPLSYMLLIALASYSLFGPWIRSLLATSSL